MGDKIYPEGSQIMALCTVLQFVSKDAAMKCRKLNNQPEIGYSKNKKCIYCSLLYHQHVQ